MKKILIVEDDEVVRILIKECLNNRFDLDEACDGDIAAYLIAETDYDLVISDITMPKMNGTTLAIISAQLKPQIPFIILSQIVSEYKSYRSDYPNVKVWIEKPFKPTMLIGMVDGIFGGHLDHL
jgi:DNA-binding response OmpR family regulator